MDDDDITIEDIDSIIEESIAGRDNIPELNNYIIKKWWRYHIKINDFLKIKKNTYSILPWVSKINKKLEPNIYITAEPEQIGPPFWVIIYNQYGPLKIASLEISNPLIKFYNIK